MKKWKSLLIFVPFIALVVVTNIFTDVMYEVNSKSIAQSILNDNCVGFPDACVIPERGMKENIIKLMPKSNRSVAIGPSLIMGLREHDVDVNSFYNLGMSSSSLDEQLAQLGLLEYTGSQYNNLIWCFDYYIFDDNFSGGMRDKSLNIFKDYMLGLINNSESKSISQYSLFKSKLLKIHNIISGLFSLRNFKYSILPLMNSSFGELIAGYEVFDDEVTSYPGSYYKSDGSYVYSADYRSKSYVEVEKKIKDFDLDTFVSKNKHINNDDKDTVEKIVRYLVNKGVDVKIFLCPHPPIIWDRMVNESDYYLPAEIDEFAKEIKEKYGCRIIGSHNPYDINIKNEDFYDATHIRHEKFSEYFDFKS